MAEEESQMKIAFITPEFITEDNFDGGLANYLSHISTSLKDRGHEIHVITSSKIDETIDYNGVCVHRVNIPKLPFNRIPVIRRFSGFLGWLVQSYYLNRKLKGLIKVHKLDVAQFSSYAATAFFAPNSLPIVVRISSYQPLWDEAYGVKKTFSHTLINWLEVFSLKKADSVYGPSTQIADVVSKVIDKPISIIETPATLEYEFDDSVYRQVLDLKEYLLFFGTLGILKGVSDIADIIKQLLSEYPDLYFVFSGKDGGFHNFQMKDYLMKSAGEFSSRLIFTGPLKKPSLNSLIKNAKLIVLPSRIDNLPNACIESMGLGKVVIGTRGASFDQLIKDLYSGILVEIKNPKSLMDGIKRGLELSASEIETISNNARTRTELLRPDYICSELEQYFNNVIKR